MANNVGIKITADVADLTAKRAVMSAELKAATKDLNDLAQAARGGMTDGLQADLLRAGERVAQFKSQITALNVEMRQVGASAGEGSAFSRLKDSIEGAKGSITGMIAPISLIQESMRGLGEAIAAAFAIEAIAGFVEKMAQAAEEVQHAATTFGESTADIQRLKAEAAGSGVPFATFTNAMQRADAALTRAREGAKNAETAFRTLGINIKEPISNAELLQRTFDGLRNIQDIATRNGLAMQIFGRNIQDIAPIIGATKEQQDALNASIEASGAINADAQAKAYGVAEAVAQMHVAFQGVSNVMAEAFAPLLALVVDGLKDLIQRFVQSYQRGGDVKTIMDALVLAGKILVEVLVDIGETLVFCVRMLLAFYYGLKNVADLESGNFIASQKDTAAALHEVAQAFIDTGNAREFLNRMWASGGPTGKDMGDAGDAKSKGGAGGLPDLSSAKKTKAPKSRVGEWQDDLDKQLEGQKNILADSTAFEMAYWQNILDHEKLTGEERIQIDRKVFGEKKTLAREAYASQVDYLRQSAAADTETADEASRFDKDKFAEMRADLAQQVALHQISAQDQLAQTIRINDLETAAERGVAMDKFRIFQEEKMAEQALQGTTLTQYVALMNQLVAARQRLADQIGDINRQGQIKDEQATNAETANYVEKWRNAIGQITRTFANGLMQIMQGQRSFVGVMRDLGMSIVQTWAQNIAKSVSDWAGGIAAKIAKTLVGNSIITAATATAATEQGAINSAANKKGVVQDAYAAAAKAYKAMAGIFPAPLWGILAGGAAFAGVMAFESMIPSASGGFDIPSGVNPLTQLHEQEMVLPASIARPLRGMIAANDAGANDGGGLGGGNHYHTHNWHLHGAIDGVSLQRVLQNNPTALAAGMESLVRKRNGKGFGSAAG